MKTLKLFLGTALLFGAMCMVSCKKDNPVVTPPAPPVEEIEFPVLPAVSGKVVIVAYFEQMPCGDVVFAGSPSWDAGALTPERKFMPIGEIGGKTWTGWYKVEIDTMGTSAEKEGKSYLLAGKPVQLKDGTFDWAYQVGYDVATDVKVIGDGLVDLYPGYSGEVDIYYPSTEYPVVLVFKKWKNNPCAADIPAGNGTFKVAITGGFVEGSDIIFTGNFADKSWGGSDRVMILGNDGKYTWTGDYPVNFECKVIMLKDGVQTWADGSNKKFDGSNYEFEFEFAVLEPAE